MAANPAKGNFFTRSFLIKSLGYPSVAILALLFISVMQAPRSHGPDWPIGMLNARSIAIALFEYAEEHDGKYPEGRSSTEVFQKLMDEGCVYNAGIFYYPMAGKVEPAPDAKTLLPKNVSWDVTCCVDKDSPDSLPLVFLSGYKISYVAGTKAIPIKTPDSASLPSWWHPYLGALALCGKDNRLKVIKASPDGSIPNVIPADFDAKGKTYWQLTPEGVLNP